METLLMSPAARVDLDFAPPLLDSKWAELEAAIEVAWAASTAGLPCGPIDHEAVEDVIAALDRGELRSAQRLAVGVWHTHEWIKKAILLSFRFYGDEITRGAGFTFCDKVGNKFQDFDDAALRASGVRVIPPAVARRGCYLAPGVILVPCFVNIGAYVDSGTMVDGFANVGSCAQIGKNVHLSVGVCIGGVLEPMHSSPTIVEDNCFIGANSSIVEGVIVEENSVIAMGVHIGQSTKIYDRATGRVSHGRVPAGSVVVAGSLPADDGPYSIACAVITKRVDERTRAKTSVNALLRG